MMMAWIFISLVVLLLNHTVMCFNTVKNNFQQRQRYQAIPWEEQIREEAVDILLPVFFPNSYSNNGNHDSIQQPISAEKSLKKCLRKRYQKLESHHHSHNKTANESRGRLAALTIGTSVMRLRYWYNVISRSNLQMQPIPYPLDSTTIDSLELSTDSSNITNSIEERELIRYMIDEHANYLSSTSTSDSIHLQSNCDKATRLSIQYSIPIFLTSLLIKQYTYKQVEQICIQMNNPGPITLRRNAIQFSGSDEDLCQYLLDEYGINARVCRQPHEDYQNNKLLITANSYGNRYIVGSSSNHGYIKPPKGALKLLPQQSNNETTAVEQRRNQKSIWSMQAYKNGYFEVQDMGSQIIVQSLELSGGGSVLDYCSGNGGKTFAAASALMNDNRNPQHSKIVAHDVVEERLRQIKGSMTRVGFQKVDKKSNELIFFASNGENKCTIQLRTSSNLEASFNSFDAVLVDAPCSSSGVLRRRPSQRWELTEKEVCKVLPSLQLEIILKAASFVSDGGRLVYSTCSLLREENESIVKQFEQSSEGFEPWDFDISNSNDLDGEESDEVPNLNMQHTITLLPSDESDGFFIARWKRVL